jgi:predicted GIY-YIG superfamily endonuclease
MNMNINIYILKLEDNKFYVGQAKNIENRFKQHLKGRQSSEWTKLYKPLEIIKVYETKFNNISEAMPFENRITINCMKKYGWENVRGGDFCSLDKEKIRFLLALNSDLGNEILPIQNPKNYNLIDNGFYFFVLLLENNNYYVGATKSIRLAIINEFNGLGSEWTKIHKPIKLVNLIKIRDSDRNIIKKKHNELVIYFMKKKGFRSVRGGDFYKVVERNHKNKVFNCTNIFNKNFV